MSLRYRAASSFCFSCSVILHPLRPTTVCQVLPKCGVSRKSVTASMLHVLTLSCLSPGSLVARQLGATSKRDSTGGRSMNRDPMGAEGSQWGRKSRTKAGERATRCNGSEVCVCSGSEPARGR